MADLWGSLVPADLMPPADPIAEAEAARQAAADTLRWRRPLPRTDRWAGLPMSVNISDQRGGGTVIDELRSPGMFEREPWLSTEQSVQAHDRYLAQPHNAGPLSAAGGYDNIDGIVRQMLVKNAENRIRSLMEIAADGGRGLIAPEGHFWWDGGEAPRPVHEFYDAVGFGVDEPVGEVIQAGLPVSVGRPQR